MTILEKTNLIKSAAQEKMKLIENYDNVESHYRDLYAHHNRQKYVEEMEFYNFLISKWDEYKFNLEKKHLHLN